MVKVVLDGVSKRWGSFTGVDNLNITIEDQELLVLLGPSGCGKTTTMRMIAGLETVTDGEIRIDGVRVNDRPARDRDISMVFQSYGLYPHMSVRDNIGYPLKLRGVEKAKRVMQVQEVAEKVHLNELLDRKPRALSGGQRQRVALARSIVRSPTLFLMDEPLSNLDALLRVSMRAELKHLHRELKTTTVYVTHDQIEAMSLATRVAVMNNGELMQVAPPEEIYNDPETLFVGTFIGSPPMNIVHGELFGGTFTCCAGQVDGLNTQWNKKVTLGFRSDHVSLCEPDLGDLKGRVFAHEYTGAGLLVTVETEDKTHLTVPADLNARPNYDEFVGLKIDRAAIFLFDQTDGKRLRI